MSTGLYRPEDVRDNCGFGLIAHMQGTASHELLKTAIESLTCMTHRGGIAADGKTGDGCGLLLKKPDSFLRQAARDAFGGELTELYGIGQIFLSQDEGKAAAAPPTDPSALAYDHGAGLQSVQTQSVTFENSPLAGQGAFDPDPEHRPLYGKHVLITAGPTREPIDPVRYIANRSSGKQGFAIAAMAAAAGARVTLIAGPVHLPTPVGVDRIDVETAEDMAEEVRRALPVDIAFMVAAVADWKSRHVAGEKMKKRGSAPPALILAENPDILAGTAAGRKRPTLLIGFAAETENVIENAKSKRKRKGADWIVANNVAGDVGESVMGADLNQVHIVTAGGVESLPEMAKEDVARELVLRAAEALAPGTRATTALTSSPWLSCSIPTTAASPMASCW